LWRIQVTEIDLSRNNFDLAALELAEILKTNTTVKKLNLKNNDMHDKATVAISEMLMCNSTITELDITCTFAGKDTKYIAEALEVGRHHRRFHRRRCHHHHHYHPLHRTHAHARTRSLTPSHHLGPVGGWGAANPLARRARRQTRLSPS